MFGNEDVRLVVECAKRALEAEDRHLTECFERRGWRSRPAGICDNMNARYYQFAIWRELMATFPWRARTERRGHDLAFYDDRTEELVAFAEIRGWWSVTGEEELPGIRRDLREKLGLWGVPGAMLVLTSQRVADAEGNLCWLADRLGVEREELVTASFRTSPWPGDEGETEFAVIGLLAKPQVLLATA